MPSHIKDRSSLGALSSALTSLGLDSEALLIKSAFINDATIYVFKSPTEITVTLYGSDGSGGHRVFGESRAICMNGEYGIPLINTINDKTLWHQHRDVSWAYKGLGYGRDMMATLCQAVESEGGACISYGIVSNQAKDKNLGSMPGFKVTPVVVITNDELGRFVYPAEIGMIKDELDSADLDSEIAKVVMTPYYNTSAEFNRHHGFSMNAGVITELAGAKSSIPIKHNTGEHYTDIFPEYTIEMDSGSPPIAKRPDFSIADFPKNYSKPEQTRDSEVKQMRHELDTNSSRRGKQ